MRHGRLLAGCLAASVAIHLAVGARYDFAGDLVERSASPGGEHAVAGDLADLVVGTNVPEPVEPLEEEEQIEPVEEMPPEEVVEESEPVEPVENAPVEPEESVELEEPSPQVALSPVLRDEVAPVMAMPEDPPEAEEPEEPTLPEEVAPEPAETVEEVEPREAEPVEPESAVADVVEAPVPAQKPEIERPKRQVKKRVVKKRKPVARGNSDKRQVRGQSRGSNTAERGDGGRKATSNYLGRVNARLQRAKRYPRRARGAEGTVMVRFTIARSGSVSGIRVVRSSGSAELDAAAVSNVKRASPLPRFPDDMPQSSQTVTVPFRYNAP